MRPTFRPLLFLSFFAARIWAGEALTPTQLEAALQDAFDRGDTQALQALTQPYRAAKAVPPELTPLSCLFVGIVFMDAPGRAIPYFERAQQEPALVVRARCWRAEAYMHLGFPLMALDVADEVRKIRPTSPAIQYIEGRVYWYNLSRTEPKWEARRKPLRDQLTYLVGACTSDLAQKHPDFEPRFFILGIDAAYAQPNLLGAMQHTRSLLAARPRHVGLTRTLLAVDHELWADYRKADLEKIEKNAALPPAEWARWQQRFRDYKTEKDHVASAHRLADECMGNTEGAADFLPGRTALLFSVTRMTSHMWKDWLAASRTPPADGVMPPRGHPRFAEFALLFARLAAASNQSGFATRAVEYLEMARTIDPALLVPDELELKLRTASHDYLPGVPFFVRELPQHVHDAAWLGYYRPVAELAPPDVFRRYVDALTQTAPNAPFVRVLQARALATEEGALERYREIFNDQPGSTNPTEIDWENYRELLADAAERTGFLDGAAAQGPSAAATFDATVERWHHGARNRTAVAEQYAYLLLRRAKAADTVDAYDTAFAAVQRALAGGSRSLQATRAATEIRKLATARAKRDRQASEQDRAIEESLARQEAAVSKKIAARQKERNEYMAWVSERMREVDLDANYGKVDPDKRSQLLAAQRYYESIVKNFCSSCKALGLQPNGEDCVACDGSGKQRESGPGKPAN